MTRKVVNAIKLAIDVLCSRWNSVCFGLLAHTCLVVAAVHQYWASEACSPSKTISFQSLEVSVVESAPLLLLELCQPVIQPYVTCKSHMHRSAYVCGTFKLGTCADQSAGGSFGNSWNVWHAQLVHSWAQMPFANKWIGKFVVELIVDLHRPCVGCQQHVTAIASSSTHLCIILHQVSCL